MRKRDEPAFPITGIQDNDESRPVGGLTKLEYTAIQVLAGILTGRYVALADEKGRAWSASEAVKHAHALWDELEKEPAK